MSRYWLIIKQIWQYRASLRQVAREPKYWIENILEINLSDLRARGVQVLILDYDGVLVSQDALAFDEDVVVWVQQAIQVFGEGKVFLLSNQPTPERQAYIEKTFPHATFLMGLPKKPDPAAIEKVIQLTNILPEHMFLIDDRLWTGILLAVRMGIQPGYVTHPKIDWSQRPLIEYGYWVLRQFERLLCRLI